MTKTKSTKRALLLSALSLLMCVSMLIGSTFAWFTDSVISGNNKIVAGNLDIELEYYNGTEWKTVNGATNLFDETLWEPGHTDVVYLRLRNIGSLALKYELAINIVSETPGINMAGDEFLLSDYIYMGVVEDINGQTNPYSKDAAGRAKAIAAATNATVISEGYAADGEMAKGANDLYMAVVVYMPTSVDNDANYRGDTAPSIDLGINLVATQLMNEKDSFGNDYDEAAKYIISSDEKMIFNGTEFDTLVSNNGTVDMTNVKIENDNTGFENYGDATLTDVTVNAGTPGTNTFGYAINAYAGSTTVLNDVTVKSANGAIGVTDGANLTFNSGSVEVDSKNTSGRYLFYVVGNGSTLTINGGNFDFNKTQNQKRAYIYAGDGTTVYVKGGTFGKASTRSGYTAGILGAGDVIITGGTFGFDPSAWVATGYQVTNNGDGTYTVGAYKVSTGAELVDAIAKGKAVELTQNVSLGKIDLTDAITNDVVINANGHKITTTDAYGIEVTAGKNITISNADVEMTKAGDYITYAAGFKIANGDYAGATITLENCTITMANTDWAYAVNMPASVKNLNLVIDNCTLEGAVAVQCWGDNNNITITNSELICNYTTSALYTSYCVALQSDGSSVSENNTLVIDNCEFKYSGVDNFNSSIYSVDDLGTGNTVTVTNCTYGEKVVAD